METQTLTRVDPDGDDGIAAAKTSQQQDLAVHDVVTGFDVTDAEPCSVPYASAIAATNVEPVQETPQACAGQPSAACQSHSEPVTTNANHSRSDANLENSFKNIALKDKFDIFILSSEQDEVKVDKFRQILDRFIRLSGNRKLSFYPESALGISRFQHLENGLKCSSFRFIFFDHGTLDNRWTTFQTHTALMKMINEGDLTIVPVKACREVLVPDLLTMYRPLEMSRLLRGRRLDDIEDVSDLKDTDVDFSVLNGIVRLVDPVSSLNSSQEASRPAVQCQQPESRAMLSIRKNYKYLVEHMEPDYGLIATLFSDQVINFREKVSVEAEKSFCDRNELLLKLMMCKSDVDYETFLKALVSTNQPHIAKLLQS